MTTHKVLSGQTLAAIARRFGVSVPALMTVNGIADPNKVRAGQTLLIPEATTDQASLPPLLPPVKPATTASGLVIDRKKFALPESQYFTAHFPKDLIVLHFTAGQTARSAFDSWINSPMEVATAYLVDTDGSVYETFNPKCWAYHLGIQGAASANHKHDKRSIGIEIANVGPLKEVNGNLNWWPKDFGAKWCTKQETSKYVARAYRGFSFYAAYPDAQLDSVSKLVRHLCAEYQIPFQLPPAAKRAEFDMGHFAGFSGVASHQNFRKDKFDVGPAFDWSRL
jgi:N-acetyl-anhydromuramyl-L-alanine amidase AmpD